MTSRRSWVLILAAGLVVAMVAASVAARFILPRPNFTSATPGPASAEALAAFLRAPAGASAVHTDLPTLDDEATYRFPYATPEARGGMLRDRGYRWSARMTWTGDDRSAGTLRLTQYTSFARAQQAVTEALDTGRVQTASTEWSVRESPRAGVFDYENIGERPAVRAAFGKGNVGGEIVVTGAGPATRTDIMSLVADLADGLPGEQWVANEPFLDPPDLGALLLETPPGAKQLIPRGSRDTLADYAAYQYKDAKAGANYLKAMRYKGNAQTAWQTRDGTEVYLTLLRFDAAFMASEWVRHLRKAFKDVGTAVSDTSGVTEGFWVALTKVTADGGHYGFTGGAKDTITVEIRVYGPKVITATVLENLLRAQIQRLP
jgi:hypothetical protein